MSEKMNQQVNNSDLDQLASLNVRPSYLRKLEKLRRAASVPISGVPLQPDRVAVSAQWTAWFSNRLVRYIASGGLILAVVLALFFAQPILQQWTAAPSVNSNPATATPHPAAVANAGCVTLSAEPALTPSPSVVNAGLADTPTSTDTPTMTPTDTETPLPPTATATQPDTPTPTATPSDTVAPSATPTIPTLTPTDTLLPPPTATPTVSLTMAIEAVVDGQSIESGTLVNGTEISYTITITNRGSALITLLSLQCSSPTWATLLSSMPVVDETNTSTEVSWSNVSASSPRNLTLNYAIKSDAPHTVPLDLRCNLQADGTAIEPQTFTFQLSEQPPINIAMAAQTIDVGIGETKNITATVTLSGTGEAVPHAKVQLHTEPDSLVVLSDATTEPLVETVADEMGRISFNISSQEVVTGKLTLKLENDQFFITIINIQPVAIPSDAIGAKLRSTPQLNDSNKVDTANQNEKLIILGQDYQHSWWWVRTDNDIEAWVHSSAVTVKGDIRNVPVISTTTDSTPTNTLAATPAVAQPEPSSLTDSAPTSTPATIPAGKYKLKPSSVNQPVQLYGTNGSQHTSDPYLYLPTEHISAVITILTPQAITDFIPGAVDLWIETQYLSNASFPWIVTEAKPLPKACWVAPVNGNEKELCGDAVPGLIIDTSPGPPQGIWQPVWISVWVKRENLDLEPLTDSP